MLSKRKLFILLMIFALSLIPSSQAQIPGNKLFFFSEGDIWTWFVNAESATQVTEWGYNGGPILSPTERYVAYLSLATEGVEEINNSGFYPFAGSPPSNIWLMDTATLTAERIATQSNYPVIRGIPTWSPTGGEIAWLETFTNEGYATRLVVYNLNNRQTRILSNSVNLGFQDGGIYVHPLQWGTMGISRMYLTFVESGQGQFILEVYASDTGNLSQFVLATINNFGENDGALPIDYIWVEHQARSMIAVLNNDGSWYLLDPSNGSRNALSEAPSLVSRNGNGTSLTPIWQATNNSGWEITWRASNGSSSFDLPFSSYRISQGEPAIAPDGNSVAWNINGAVSFQNIDGSDGGIVYYAGSDENAFNPVQPVSLAWSSMRWITKVDAGNPIPTPVVSNPNTGDACQVSSRIERGDYVTVNAGVPNNVRAAASLSASIAGMFATGDAAQVTDGPICADGFRWWFISNEVLAGWTAEGNTSDYWLVPLAQSPWTTSCTLAPRLRTGNTAIVLGNTPNVLRDAPDANGSSIIGQVPAGATVRILGDSLCGTDGRRWYPVNYNGQLGWTAEGEGSSYWLEAR